MVVRIRLARHGTRNNPFYHIVAIRDQAARDARPIEKLGEWDVVPRLRQPYDGPLKAWSNVGIGQATPGPKSHDEFDRPIFSSGIDPNTKKEKRVEWNVSRVQHWLSVGAQPSKPVAKLLYKAGLIPEGKWYKGIYRPVAEVEAAQALYLQAKEGANKTRFRAAVQRAQDVNTVPEPLLKKEVRSRKTEKGVVSAKPATGGAQS